MPDTEQLAVMPLPPMCRTVAPRPDDTGAARPYDFAGVVGPKVEAASSAYAAGLNL
jgi:hypothetical protein